MSTTEGSPLRAADGGLRILTRPGHPGFLDLPWDRPLTDWRGGRLVEVARGVHRHVVRFVDYDGRLYALKELPPRVAQREYRLLRKMAEESLPVVEAVGVVHREPLAGDPLEDVLITRFLDYSLPYRTLFTHRRREDEPDVRGMSERLLDALAMLLVRLHLTGFYWGDCSLSNTLFRRDAGALAAYCVDLETGEWHEELTDGQRLADLEVTELNVAGGLMDLQAELDLPPDPDPVETAEDLRRRYDALWDELTTDVLIGPDEQYRIEARMRRLNELGFDIDEVELVSTAEGNRLRMRTSVTEQGHHRRRLFHLTGLEAQENQARSLLNDLANFRASEEARTGRPAPEQVTAYQWLTWVFEPTVAAIPEELRAKLEPAEVFHEVIEHKWFLSERAGQDVGIGEALDSYLEEVLPAVPDEKRVLAEDDTMTGYMGFG
jgi:hypothetical protein